MTSQKQSLASPPMEKRCRTLLHFVAQQATLEELQSHHSTTCVHMLEESGDSSNGEEPPGGEAGTHPFWSERCGRVS